VWEIELCRLPIDWEDQGAAWEHHLGVLINADASDWAPLGCTPQDDERTVLDYAPPPGELTSRLRVRRTPTGIMCSVVGDGPEPSGPEQFDPWRDAAQGAAVRLGTQRSFTWQALIGAHPRGPNMGARAVALAEAIRIGPLALSPGEVLMHQMVPYGLAPTHRNSGLVHRSWPVYVDCEVTAYNWTNAVGQAGRPLRRINALISLVWDGYWTLLEGPTTFSVAGARIEIPHVVLGSAGTYWQDKTFPLARQEECRDARTLPGWLDQVWSVLDRDAGLADALDAYYEAIRLAAEHPSVAYAMYVAAIEAVGARTVPLERCSCCETCRVDTGATRRFRTALRTVLSARKVKMLADEAYGLRSATAHIGTLHGLDAQYGQYEFSMYRADDRLLFNGPRLATIHKVARTVLAAAMLPSEHAVGDDYPLAPSTAE
jgi:hypothetical protein